MKVGIVGAGKIGRAIARHVTRSGHEVIVSNSRGAESLESFVAELGPKAKAATEVSQLIEQIGFAAVDLGGLVAGGRMQQSGGPLAGLNLVRLD